MHNIYIYALTFHISLAWNWVKTLFFIPYLVKNSSTPGFPIFSGVLSVLSKIKQKSSASRSSLAISLISAILTLLNIADAVSQTLQACVNNISLTMTGFSLSVIFLILTNFWIWFFFLLAFMKISHVTVLKHKKCVFYKCSNIFFFTCVV